MFGIGPSELIIILVLALIIFGPGKLPEVGKAIGRSIKEFKAATSSVENDIKQSLSTTTTASPASSPAPAQATATASAAQPAQTVDSTARPSSTEPAADGRASS